MSFRSAAYLEKRQVVGLVQCCNTHTEMGLTPTVNQLQLRALLHYGKHPVSAAVAVIVRRHG